MNLPRVFSKLFFGTALILSSSSVFAGFSTGTVTFTPVDPTAVPTLSGWMLIVLSVLLFAVAVKASRQNGNGAGKFFLIFMSVGILGSGTGGVKLLSDVQAGQVVPGIPVEPGIPLIPVFPVEPVIPEALPVNLPGGEFPLSSANLFENTSGQAFNFTIQPATGEEDEGVPAACLFRVITSEEFEALVNLDGLETSPIQGIGPAPGISSGPDFFTTEESGVLTNGQLLLINCIPSSFQAGE